MIRHFVFLLTVCFLFQSPAYAAHHRYYHHHYVTVSKHRQLVAKPQQQVAANCDDRFNVVQASYSPEQPPTPDKRKHWTIRTVHASSMVGGLGFGLSQMLSASMGMNAIEARRRGLPWCGAYMADLKGITGERARELWVARNWAHVGSPTTPHPTAVVVWAHHVGEIASGSCPAGEWMVTSGNDGHAVRTRCRSLHGAIAIREI